MPPMLDKSLKKRFLWNAWGAASLKLQATKKKNAGKITYFFRHTQIAPETRKTMLGSHNQTLVIPHVNPWYKSTTQVFCLSKKN